MGNELIAELMYENSEVSFDAYYEPWISQKGLARILDVDVRNVNKLLSEAYERGELDAESTINSGLIVQMEGNRKVKREIKLYNLDAILLVGFRSQSTEKAVAFRKWVAHIVRGHIQGFVEENQKLQAQTDNLTDALTEAEKGEREANYWAFRDKEHALQLLAELRHSEPLENWEK